jgi:hypothetical protein
VAEVVDKYVGTEGDAKLTALVHQQLNRLDPALGPGVEPLALHEPSADGAYRNVLLGTLKRVRDCGQAASGVPADFAGELPWQIVHLHSRAVPYWIARDVDGLRTICEAAGVEPPAGLVSAEELFSGVWRALPKLAESFEGLQMEMQRPRDVGAYAAPEHVPEVLKSLVQHGGRMIQVATRHGEGPRCATLLRKIRECLRFAERHGVGYLEVSGIHPLLEEPIETADVAESVPIARG